MPPILFFMRCSFASNLMAIDWDWSDAGIACCYGKTLVGGGGMNECRLFTWYWSFRNYITNGAQRVFPAGHVKARDDRYSNATSISFVLHVRIRRSFALEASRINLHAFQNYFKYLYLGWQLFKIRLVTTFVLYKTPNSLYFSTSDASTSHLFTPSLFTTLNKNSSHKYTMRGGPGRL